MPWLLLIQAATHLIKKYFAIPDSVWDGITVKGIAFAHDVSSRNCA
jgi:hypothetical protein